MYYSEDMVHVSVYVSNRFILERTEFNTITSLANELETATSMLVTDARRNELVKSWRYW